MSRLICPPEALRAAHRAFVTPVPGGQGPPTLVHSPLIAYPSDRPPLPAYTGQNHGDGFFNTGILDRGPSPNPGATRVTFARAGSYDYVCLIHPEMRGTIEVAG